RPVRIHPRSLTVRTGLAARRSELRLLGQRVSSLALVHARHRGGHDRACRWLRSDRDDVPNAGPGMPPRQDRQGVDHQRQPLPPPRSPPGNPGRQNSPQGRPDLGPARPAIRTDPARRDAGRHQRQPPRPRSRRRTRPARRANRHPPVVARDLGSPLRRLRPGANGRSLGEGVGEDAKVAAGGEGEEWVSQFESPLRIYGIAVSFFMFTFIETKLFTKLVLDYLADEEYWELQKLLIAQPAAGDVIPGTGGVRKLRWRTPGRGKRGGYRVIYYAKIEEGVIWMLTMYPKSVRTIVPAHVLRAIRNEVENA